MKKEIKKTTCPRCNGNGKVNFGHVAGRVCFLCKGEGAVVNSKISKQFKVTLKGFILPNHEEDHFVNVRAKSEAEATRKAKTLFIKIAKHAGSDFVISTRNMKVETW